MRKPWPPEKHNLLLADFGRIVFNFNSMERAIHRLLWLLSTRGNEDDIALPAITHLSNVAVVDALTTVLSEFYQDPIAEHARHLIKLFGILREYRNYYVHGFNNVDFYGGGFLKTTSARGNIVDHELRITISDVQKLADCLHEAHEYAALIYCCSSEFMQNGSLSHWSWPEKFPLPDRLNKPRNLRLSEAD